MQVSGCEAKPQDVSTHILIPTLGNPTRIAVKEASVFFETAGAPARNDQHVRLLHVKFRCENTVVPCQCTL
jgi:hypothetical protein